MSPFVRPDAVRVDEMLADAAVAVLQHRNVVEICALTDGLRGALAVPLPDLTPDVARRVLVRRLHALRVTSSAGSPA